MFRTIEWTDRGVVMLDQRLLPEQEVYVTLTTPEEVAQAIRDMTIRGAPAIGVAAAMGIALGFAGSAAGATGARGSGSAAGGHAAGDRSARFEDLARLLAST